MARWIPTKRQKYGVGECSPGRGAALPGAKLGGGQRALGARVARVGVRLPLPCGVQPDRRPAPDALRGALPPQQSGGGMGDEVLSPPPEPRGEDHFGLWEAECLKVQLGSGAGPLAPLPRARGPVIVETSKARVLAGCSFGAPAPGLAPLLLVVRFHSGVCKAEVGRGLAARLSQRLLPPFLRFSLKPQSEESGVESRPPHFLPGTGMLITVVK